MSNRSLGITVDKSAVISETPLSEIPKIVESCRNTFNNGITLPVEFRKKQLLNLYQMIDQNQKAWIKAVQDHMHRPFHEIANTEISTVLSEIAYLYNNLDKFVQPKKIPSTAAFLTDTGEIRYTPRGCALIMSTWNFPVQLLLSPFAGAVAAGCTVVLRPSEIANSVATLVKELVPKYMDQQCYQVVVGGVPQNQEILKQKFDMIFYTGSCAVGKLVSQAAVKHLTPVLLELGGKNPVIIDETVDLSTAARRIVWGRYALNTGQVCLAPEYVMLPRNLEKPFVDEAKKAIEEFFGVNPQISKEYGRIVSENHFQRLSAVLNDNKSKIVYGGQTDARERYIAPTILSNVTKDDPIMRDEVFGPILSVMPVDDLKKDAISYIKAHEKPLSLYVFSKNTKFANEIVDNTDAGGVTINDVIMHFAFNGFPFGGTGASGVGRYHGHYSFTAFSHEKPVLWKYHGAEFINKVRYPPYTEQKSQIYRALTEEKIQSWKMLTPLTVAGGLGALAFWLQSRL